MTPEERYESNMKKLQLAHAKLPIQEAAALGGKTCKENKIKRKTFKELFAERLPEEKAVQMVDAFVNMVLDESVGVKDRRAAFELILKVLGEYDNLSSNEIKKLDSVIKLKIV